VDSPNIALGDSASKFQVTLEIQDKNDGQDTDKIDVYVSFKDNSPENGSNQKLKYYLNLFLLQLLQLEQENYFTVVAVTIAELKAKFGITDLQYTGGDQFVIRLAQVLKTVE
jgi:hypothetical protein